MHGRDRRFVTSLLRDRFMSAVVIARNTPGTHNNSAVYPFSVWRLIYAKNPDMQTRYNSIVNIYFFKYSDVNMLIRIVGC